MGIRSSFYILALVFYALKVLAVDESQTIINEVADQFNIPVLKSEACDGKDLGWFKSIQHVAHDSNFVLKLLASQLHEEGEESFKSNRALLAKFTLEQFLKKVCEDDSPAAFLNLSERIIPLVNIILKEEKYVYFIELLITYPKLMKDVFFTKTNDDFPGFFKYLKTLSEAELRRFYELVRSELSFMDAIKVYIDSFKQLVPHEYYLKDLFVYNPTGFETVFLNKLFEVDEAENKMEIIGKLEAILDSLKSNSSFARNLHLAEMYVIPLEHLKHRLKCCFDNLERHLRFIKFGKSATLADLGFEDQRKLPDELKYSLILKSIRFGRENIKNELINNVYVPIQFFNDKLKLYGFEQSQNYSPTMLPFVFSAIQQLYPRDHPDLWKFNGHLFEFLCSNSAIDKIEFTENLNAEITFISEAEQVALGAPKTFVSAIPGPLSLNFIASLFSSVKFATPQTFMNLLIEIEAKFPDIMNYFQFASVEISAHNLIHIIRCDDLIDLIKTKQLLFTISRYADIIEISKLSKIKSVQGNIIVQLQEDIIAGFTNTRFQMKNLMKLTDMSLAELMLSTVFSTSRNWMNEYVYFKCRRVFSIWANSPDYYSLNNIHFNIIERLLGKDFPHLGLSQQEEQEEEALIC